MITMAMVEMKKHRLLNVISPAFLHWPHPALAKHLNSPSSTTRRSRQPPPPVMIATLLIPTGHERPHSPNRSFFEKCLLGQMVPRSVRALSLRTS